MKLSKQKYSSEFKKYSKKGKISLYKYISNLLDKIDDEKIKVSDSLYNEMVDDEEKLRISVSSRRMNFGSSLSQLDRNMFYSKPKMNLSDYEYVSD